MEFEQQRQKTLYFIIGVGLGFFVMLIAGFPLWVILSSFVFAFAFMFILSRLATAGADPVDFLAHRQSMIAQQAVLDAQRREFYKMCLGRYSSSIRRAVVAASPDVEYMLTSGKRAALKFDLPFDYDHNHAVAKIVFSYLWSIKSLPIDPHPDLEVFYRDALILGQPIADHVVSSQTS